MEEILAILKKALVEAGLKEDSESYKRVIENPELVGFQIPGKVPTEFVEILKIPGLKSQYDKRITEAIKTRESNLKQKYDFVEKEKAGKNDGEGSREGVDKELIERLATLEENEKKRVREMELKYKKQEAEKLLKDKSIPGVFVNHFDFGSGKKLEEQVVEIEKIFSDLKQGIINDNVGSKGFPFGKKNLGKVTDEEIEMIVDGI